MSQEDVQGHGAVVAFRPFEEDGALDRLEAFASEFGPRFYGLPLNEGTITLERTEVSVPANWATPLGDVRIYHGGETLPWRLLRGAC